jgi:hypothetical protein
MGAMEMSNSPLLAKVTGFSLHTAWGHLLVKSRHVVI